MSLTSADDSEELLDTASLPQVLLALPKDASRATMFSRRLNSVAKDKAFIESVAFVTLGAQHPLREDFGVEKDDGPILLARKKASDGDSYLKFKLPSAGKKLTAAELKSAAQDVLSGANIEPYVKSEPVPENNNGPVKVVTGRV